MSTEIQPEWKTIRIGAPSYYKLVEMTGFFSIILGEQTSLSFAAEMAIDTFYNATHKEMLAVISDPQRLEKMREDTKGRLQRLAKLLEPLRKVEKSGSE